MRKQMTICGELFDIEPAEGGNYMALWRRDSRFFFTGKSHADLRRKMPDEMNAWTAERAKARELSESTLMELMREMGAGKHAETCNAKINRIAAVRSDWRSMYGSKGA